MLEKDPTKRIFWPDIVKHPYFSYSTNNNKSNFNNLINKNANLNELKNSN